MDMAFIVGLRPTMERPEPDGYDRETNNGTDNRHKKKWKIDESIFHDTYYSRRKFLLHQDHAAGLAICIRSQGIVEQTTSLKILGQDIDPVATSIIVGLFMIN